LERNRSISSVRFIAMIFIVLSHLFQYYSSFPFLIFNIGVQLFFIISGILYGNKLVSNYKEWFKKRFKKVLIPYYLYVIISALALLIVNDYSVLKEIWKYLLILPGVFSSSIVLGNLWFVTIIVICYLMLPLLQRFDFSKNRAPVFYLKLLLVLLVLLVLEYITGLYKFTSNLFCFISAYYFTRRYTYFKLEAGLLLSIFKRFLIILTPLVFVYYIYYIPSNEGVSFLLLIPKYLAPFALGITLYNLLHYLFSDPKLPRAINRLLEKCVTYSDKYSYYIYLTHHLFILTNLSLMALTPYMPLNITLVIAAFLAYSYVLSLLTKKVTKLI